MSKPRSRKKIALGKGLSALIPDVDSYEEGEDARLSYFNCDIDRIQPNPYQPRIAFNDADLEELARSIREQGVIQPLILRPCEDGYELVAGERRLRAAKKAGLDQVPCIIKPLSDAQMLEVSIVENIQRQNLNPVEEAEAYHRLMTEFSLTQDQAAERVGRSRSAVANFLRIRKLPEQIRGSLVEGTLKMGHARAVLGLENKATQLAAWRTILSRKLSVRQTEALINRMKKENVSATAPRSSQKIYFSNLADELSRHFGTKVQIRRQGKKGRIAIEFYSDDDLDRLLGLLNTG